jgi:biotin carboxylase
MIDSDEVLNEGFKPLKKRTSSHAEPTTLARPHMPSRGMSFNAETGEKESSQAMWEGSSWEKFGRSKGKTMDKANSFVGRANSFVGGRDNGNEPLKEIEGAVVIVDPFSTGAFLASEVRKRGVKCARVLSAWDSPVASLVAEGVSSIDFCATIQHNDRLSDQDLAVSQTVEALQDLPFPILAVIPGAETGVELADQLSSRLRLRTNGTAKSVARRNKYYMGETVRAAGVRAVKQEICSNVEQMVAFLEDLKDAEGNLRCVVKPVQSAGTDDVFLCQSLEEAEVAFSRIIGKVNGIGIMNENVLVQEFLRGKEYVVDKVSKDGVHKLVAIWEYDKRKANGANFVYFGMRLKPSDSELAKVMVPYADKILDALGIMNGPSHMEVMVNTVVKDGVVTYEPCLVEVGARCHGGEGTWLSVAMECVGYTQVLVTLDAYLGGGLFERIQKDNFPLHKAGREVDMVSRNGGIVRSLPGDAAIRKLPSFRSLNWEVKPGDYCHKTIDCFTRPGCVQLVADTEEDAERDLEAIHSLEHVGLIDYAVICPKPPTIGAVVVVDPFSTGANLAAAVVKYGYKLIMVFSELDGPVLKLVAKGALMIQHNNRHANQEEAIQDTLSELEKSGEPILAIIPGAETGVELAERLATRFGTRTNGEEMLITRRSKFNMHDSLQNAVVRHAFQALCRSEAEVRGFVHDLSTKLGGKQFQCIVKPNQSAGSDSVILCHSEQEAIEAFHAVHGQINGLGHINDGALCQEFLDGKEFIVDGISRDGVFKVVAVWECDKRSVNDANFVFFGMKLRDASDPEIRALLEYSKNVIEALKIFQGPSHLELKLPSKNVNGELNYEPCLVEIATRCHGGEGTWTHIVNECIGYNQVEATLNCYLRPDRFDELPFEPILLGQGLEVFLVSYQSGNIVEIPGLDQIRDLQSFRRCEMLTQPGSFLRPTKDCFTRPGSIQLANKSSSQLESDHQAIRRLERDGLFDLQ